ncbi:MAG: polyhydroxyalkanoic acid system family protein [Myxococcota bacterium]
MTSVLLCLALSAAPVQGDSQLHIHTEHSFTVADAKERVRLLLDYWSQRFGVRAEWHGDEANVLGTVWGVAFRARLTVGALAVDAEVSDPGAILRGSAHDYIAGKLRKYLHPRFEDS